MKIRTSAVFVALIALAACGGGGAGGASGGGGGVTPPSGPAASVQGDMLALVPSRGWNYHSLNISPASTISLYANPTLINNVRALIGAGVNGTVTTVLTSTSSVTTNVIGVLGVRTDTSTNASAFSELSYGSSAEVPGTPLLVPSSLTQGQTWSPYPGASARVVAVGAVPNANACPVPTSGAQVEYTFQNFDVTVAYVPGCGITDYKNNANGAELALVSVGSYPAIGQITSGVETLSVIDTARSLLGLGRNPSFRRMPAP